MKKSDISDLFGIKPEMDKKSIHDKIVELEHRWTWISVEMRAIENELVDENKYSSEMIESLEEEMNLLNLLTNVLYRRDKIVEKEAQQND